MLQNSLHSRNSRPKTPSMESARPAFVLEETSLSFGEHTALKNINLRINRGEIVFLTGPSGAGKTSLLNLLNGTINASSGKLKKIGAKQSILISTIFQDLRLIPEYSLRENLMASYDPAAYKTKKEFLQDLKELAKVLGIFDRLDLKVHDANGGLKQKVAFLRAVLSRPDIILADEPTAALDFDNAKKMYDILNIFNARRGLTVVWASHNKDLVKKFSGRIIHLEKGRLIHAGNACFI